MKSGIGFSRVSELNTYIHTCARTRTHAHACTSTGRAYMTDPSPAFAPARDFLSSLGLRCAETSDQKPPRLACGRRGPRTTGIIPGSGCPCLVYCYARQTELIVCVGTVCVCETVRKCVCVRADDHCGIYFWLGVPFYMCSVYNISTAAAVAPTTTAHGRAWPSLVTALYPFHHTASRRDREASS